MSNELMHYGILGMKWGVRRTPEQLGHAPSKGANDSSGWSGGSGGSGGGGSGKSGGFISRIKNKREEKEKNKTVNLSDEELRARINRLSMEESYENLLARQKERNQSSVRKVFGNVMESLGNKIISKATDALVEKMFNRDGKTNFSDFDDIDTGDMDFATNRKLAKYVENAKEIEKYRNRNKKTEEPARQEPKKDEPKKQESKKDEPKKQEAKKKSQNPE